MKTCFSRHITALIFTTHESFIDIYEIMRNTCNIVGIVVPANRKNTEKLARVIEKCKCNDIQVFEHPYRNDMFEFNQFISSQGINFGVSWSYSQIIQPETLSLFKYGIWNMHGGKIPEYRGANVLQWAIINGEDEIGVTWHMMDTEIDAGDILYESTVAIRNEDDAITVREKIFKEGIFGFSVIWGKFLEKKIETKKVRIPFNIPVYKPRKPIDGLITHEFSKKKVENLLRAQCDPWPSPLIYYNGIVYHVLGFAQNDNEENTLQYQLFDGIVLLKTMKCVDQQLVESITAMFGDKLI